MNKKRDCKRCNSSLIDMDPHTICKPCRQPDPQMFYCSEDDCEACNVIKIYKPLDLILRKQELKNIKKKIDNFSSQHSKTDKSVTAVKKKNDKKMKNIQNIPASASEEKVNEFSSEVFKNVLNGLFKEKSENLSNSPKNDLSVLNSNGKSDDDNFHDLEKRIYERVMSNLMNSMSTDSKINASGSELFNNPSSSSSPSPCSTASSSKFTPTRSLTSSSIKNSDEKVVSSNSDIIDIDKTEIDLQDTIISLFEESFPDAISKLKKSSSDDKCEYNFKVSSAASDILSKETLLSSPSQASKLCEELGIDTEMSYWPSDLNIIDLLHTNFGKLVNMKLHPKFRHMHTVLFGKLNPSLPEEVLGQSFVLNNVSAELKNEFLFAREQLQRIILMFSIVDYYCRENVTSETTKVVNLLEVLLNLLKISMKKQSNFIGLLIQEMRRDLLNDAECKESEAVSKMIFGPIHQTQFFGPYVKELSEIIKKYGSSYAVNSKSEKANVNLTKLPSIYKEGDSIEKFIENLESFFDTNKTLDRDKPSILENLLPCNMVESILSFIKPLKLPDKSFNELSDILRKIDVNSSDCLIERLKFSKLKQSKGQSVKTYIEELEKQLSKCMYGSCSREMLRDQFVFGLADSDIQDYLLCKSTWSFDECANYVENYIKGPLDYEFYDGQAYKASIKRKHEECSETNKKLNVSYYNDVSEFNLHCKNKVIPVSNLQEWNEHFGFDITHTYKVYCPWTGQLLRG